MAALTRDDVWCRRCGSFTFNSVHRCPPTWDVWCLDYGETEEDAVAEHAFGPPEAAAAWAEYKDRNGDYSIVGGAEVMVAVRRTGDPEASISYFVIYGETMPHYRAHKMRLEDFQREVSNLVRRGRYHEAGRLYGRMFTLSFDTGTP